MEISKKRKQPRPGVGRGQRVAGPLFLFCSLRFCHPLVFFFVPSALLALGCASGGAGNVIVTGCERKYRSPHENGVKKNLYFVFLVIGGGGGYAKQMLLRRVQKKKKNDSLTCKVGELRNIKHQERYN
jgi:hypothetical protein